MIFIEIYCRGKVNKNYGNKKDEYIFRILKEYLLLFCFLL